MSYSNGVSASKNGNSNDELELLSMQEHELLKSLLPLLRQKKGEAKRSKRDKFVIVRITTQGAYGFYCSSEAGLIRER